MFDGEPKSEIPAGVATRLNGGPYDYYEVLSLQPYGGSADRPPSWIKEGQEFPFRDQALAHAAALRSDGAEAVVVIGRKYP